MVNSVFFESTDHQEIVNICDSLRPGTAAGYDNIHMDVIKSTTDLISKLLARIINLSMASGIVPNELKIQYCAKVLDPHFDEFIGFSGLFGAFRGFLTKFRLK